MTRATNGFRCEPIGVRARVNVWAGGAHGILTLAMRGIHVAGARAAVVAAVVHVEGESQEGFRGSAGFSPDAGRCGCGDGGALK